MEASFQSNMDWVKSEIGKIKDPNFLAKVAELLKKRPSAKEESNTWEKKRLMEVAEASEKDIKAGRVHTIEEIEKMLESSGL